MNTAAALWLLCWLACTIVLNLLNKAIFQIADFQYPYFLSAVHMLCNSIGSEVVFLLVRADPPLETDKVTRPSSGIQRRKLNDQEELWLLAYSVIFSLSIALGNVSLKHVSVNFNQVMRALSPAVIMTMSSVVLGKRFSTQRRMTIVPVIVGVALACMGDLSYTLVGLFYTVLCVLASSAKSVASGELLTGSFQLHPLDLLGHM